MGTVVAFSERVQQDAQHFAYYERIRNCLLSYKGVKSRSSIRCDSYRYKGKLIAKIAIGGHTPKPYLYAARPPGEEGSKKEEGDGAAGKGGTLRLVFE